MADGSVPKDYQLVESLKNGERQGIESFLSQYFEPIVRRAINHHSLTPEDAEELVDDVLLEVMKRIDAFDPKKRSLATFIATTTRQKAIDFYRKYRQRKETEVYPADEEEWNAISQDRDQLAEASSFELDADTCRRVQEALAKLSGRDQEILRLGCDGHSRKNMAAWLECSSNAAAVAYNRAKERFRKFFETETVRI